MGGRCIVQESIQMKKLIQTRLHSETQRGNCFPTVIACFMDLDSAEDVIQIQEHYDDDKWLWKLLNWLNERGWEMGTLHDGHLQTGEYYLVTGKTSRGTRHVCIYQNGELFHDPHPSGEGLITEENFEYLEYEKSNDRRN